MKKNHKLLLILVAVFTIITTALVYAKGEEITALSIDCGKTSVELGEQLGEFTITNQTDNMTIDSYGENTTWAYKKNSNDEWTKVTSIYNAGEGAHYALRLYIVADEGYEFGEIKSISFNGEDYTNEGYTEYESIDLSHGYLYIDLGTPTNNTEEPSDPEEPEAPVYYNFTVSFNGGTYVSSDEIPQKVPKGQEIEIEIPSRNFIIPPKLKEFDAVEINGERYEAGERYVAEGDTTFKYLWKNVTNPYTYTLKNDEYGITVSFKEAEGIEFSFSGSSINGFMKMMEDYKDHEDYQEMMEYFNDLIEALKKQAKEYGEYLDLYEFEIEEENGINYSEGPFTIRIKMTDEMKKYKKFKMIYVVGDDNDNPLFTEETYEFTAKDGYIEGEVDHFSAYVLVGVTEEETKTEPKTGDNVLLFMLLGLVSLGGIVTVKKLRKN